MKSISVILLLALAVVSSTIAQVPDSLSGKTLFENKCARCHGADGTRGIFGAKDLRASRITDEEMISIITNGKRIMPSWKKRLTPEQIRTVAGYVKTLRK